jgi:hypothetical protein
MRRHLGLIFVLFFLAAAAERSAADSWMFLPGYYTHSPVTGQRVDQYAAPAPSYARFGENFLQSGYQHNHIQMAGVNGEENIHIVETWGAGEWIRPYGEWERPFRPGATPYGPWNQPYGYSGNPYGAAGNLYGPAGNPYGYSGNPYGAAGNPYGPAGNPNGLGGRPNAPAYSPNYGPSYPPTGPSSAPRPQ